MTNTTPTKFVAVAIALGLCCAAACPSLAQDIKQDVKLARQCHPWARFEPGAWKKVRVVTETLDEKGNVTSTSTTDTTTLLEFVDAETYSLQLEVTVDVAGKRFQTPPQYIEQGYFGELSRRSPIFRNAAMTNIDIEDRRIPCQVFEMETLVDDQKRLTKLYYSEKVAPHLLKKESVSTEAGSANTLHETIEAVVALDMPQKVQDDIIPTSHVKTVRRNSKGSTITIEVHSPTVPGGVVAHTSKELDPKGRVIRRSTLELVDFGLEEDRQDVVRRRHYKRSAKSARRG